MENLTMQTIAILGTGLMGSSLGLALRKRNVPVRIHVYARRAETREVAVNLGIANAVFADPAKAVQDADLIVFCVPVLTIPELAKACCTGLKSGAVLTDVGSTKACLNKLMPDVLAGTGAEFIGSHPICGSEQQGIEAGSSDLYERAVTVVTPSMLSNEASLEKVSNLWKNAGSSVVVMDAVAHDKILAATSHLPHVVAAALALSAGDSGLFCGSGFRDTTRIADGSPQVWSDIVRTNAPALTESLKTFRDRLDSLEALIQEGDGEKLANWFAAARDKRKELLR
ncbi:MAG: prephenate dehydrogenase/arogenate dehydrogenase family protein [Kiritimatiellales bacterium]|nr:prephenate dehydrogenase/arogenate dehydrogenase family protein [Kiritimatiellales bacterium]